MKKLFITLLVIVLLVAGGIIAAITFYPTEKLEALVKQKAQEATGRTVEFSNVRLRAFPNLGLRISDLSIGNPDWAKGDKMLEVQDFGVSIALKPLLERKIEVKRFTLGAPRIALEKSKEGRGNWEFSSPAKAPKTKSTPISPPDTVVIGGHAFDVTLGDIKLNKGYLSYFDHTQATPEIFEGIEVVISFPDLKSALNIDGALNYKGERISLVTYLEKPMALISGDTSKGSLAIKATNIDAGMEGNFSLEGEMFAGDMKADITSLPGLLTWLTGKEASAPFEKIVFQSKAGASMSSLSLKDASLTMDDIKAKGNVNLDIGGKPKVTARLEMDHIHLDRFLPPEKEKTKGTPTISSDSQGWDDTKISFTPLKKADVDVEVQTGGFSLRGVEVGASQITAQLNNGKLHVTTSDASLFQGVFRSDLKIDTTTQPVISFDFNMKDVEAKPVLTTFADFKKLSGAADAAIVVQTMGDSQKAFVENLGGKGNVVFKNGSLEGIDLVNIAKMLQSRLTDMGVGGGKTDFVELGGTFTITKGVVSNNDLNMKGPLVQATGAGQIDLPKKYINYRVNPELTASSAETGAAGLGVPVDIKGPFSKIKVKPDYASAVKDIINNPDKIEDAGRAVRDQAKGLKDAIKGFGKGGNPADALGSIFGVPAPAPIPEPVTP